MQSNCEFLVDHSELFDIDFYCSQLHQAEQKNLCNVFDVVGHFCDIGWRQGVSPSELFCVHSYISHHQVDCEEASFNPLRHWIESGSRFCDLGFTQADFLKRVADHVIERPLSPPELLNDAPTVAVVLHAFHKDQCRLCITALSNLPHCFDLYVSTTAELRDDLSSLLGSLDNLGKITIRCFHNIGRDIAPFLVGFASVLQNYDYVLKLHTKRSAHNSALKNWLDIILRSLLGSEWVVKENWRLLEDSSVGIIMPPPVWSIAYALKKNSCWGYQSKNYYRCSREREKMKLMDLDTLGTFKFPAGSMFWCKPAAIHSLLDLNLRWTSFDREFGQIDGTLAHGLERLLGLACTNIHGFECRSVWPISSEFG